MHTLKFVLIVVWICFIIFTVKRGKESGDKRMEGFNLGCGCILVSFLAFLMGTAAWNDLHPEAPYNKDNPSPAAVEFVGIFFFVATFLYCLVINIALTDWSFFRSFSGLRNSRLPAGEHQLEKVQEDFTWASRIQAHPIIVILTILASILSIVAFYLQFLR